MLRNTKAVSFYSFPVIPENCIMKNATSLFMLLAFLFAKSAVQAQEPYYGSGFWYNYLLYTDVKEKEQNKATHLKQKQVLNADYSPRGLTYVYDTAGRMIGYKGGKTEIRTSYGPADQRLSCAIYKRGKLIERDSFVWIGKTLRESYSIDGKNKIFNRQRYTYDSTYVTEFLFEKLKHGKFVEYRKNVTEYYPDHSYKKITYYKNGKPKRFTVFDCNPAGQDHKVEKDSVYNCVKYDVDSLGNKIKISLNNTKEHSWKLVEYFNEKDECIARKTYDERKHGELLWAYYYKPGQPELLKFVSYKGVKEYYRIENGFDANGRVVAVDTYIRGKLKGRERNEYNERGLIAKTEKLNKRNKKTKEITYLYQYY
ncbi:MAG: hypothetical protein JWO09_1773 [Bacteroidetes bacterium]|nr:hypothetical protein [Bacteroidota bacterium]